MTIFELQVVTSLLLFARHQVPPTSEELCGTVAGWGLLACWLRFVCRCRVVCRCNTVRIVYYYIFIQWREGGREGGRERERADLWMQRFATRFCAHIFFKIGKVYPTISHLFLLPDFAQMIDSFTRQPPVWAHSTTVQVDVAIIEVGMGGLEDATNVLLEPAAPWISAASRFGI